MYLECCIINNYFSNYYLYRNQSSVQFAKTVIVLGNWVYSEVITLKLWIFINYFRSLFIYGQSKRNRAQIFVIKNFVSLTKYASEKESAWHYIEWKIINKLSIKIPLLKCLLGKFKRLGHRIWNFVVISVFSEVCFFLVSAWKFRWFTDSKT